MRQRPLLHSVSVQGHVAAQPHQVNMKMHKLAKYSKFSTAHLIAFLHINYNLRNSMLTRIECKADLADMRHEHMVNCDRQNPFEKALRINVEIYMLARQETYSNQVSMP